MPKQTIDRNRLLDEAYHIAESQGLSTLSVRKLAAACNVSAGSVYTYFPSKGELVSAIIERFFQQAFCADYCKPAHRENFVAFLRRLAASIDETLAAFRADWIAEIENLPADERRIAHEHEAKVMEHIEEGLVQVLLDDPDIVVTLPQTGPLAPQALCRFVFSSLISTHAHDDDETLFALLQHALYESVPEGA